MTGWRMEPAGVEAVAAAVVPHSETITTGILRLPTANEDVVQGGASELVDAAMSVFFEHTGALLQAVQQRIPAALGGLKDTATAIALGDDEMATSIDAHAVTGFSGPPSAGNRGAPR